MTGEYPLVFFIHLSGRLRPDALVTTAYPTVIHHRTALEVHKRHLGLSAPDLSSDPVIFIESLIYRILNRRLPYIHAPTEPIHLP
jgi:hypothetical protein